MGNGGMFIILGDRGGSDVLSREMETGHIQTQLPSTPPPFIANPLCLFFSSILALPVIYLDHKAK